MEIYNFIKVHSVSSSIGNRVDESFIRARDIQCIAPCCVDHTKVGGATNIYMINGSMFVVTETMDEVVMLLDRSEKERINA